ncbi:MAG TPA: CARDB domain-containing protein [Aggregatilineaceae bacterium]|jgi:hypothetical protein|nr:CARDB domain-containing protein [Aggregatilineaceae bacterium]
MHNRSPFFRTAPVIAIVSMLLAALACNLQIGGGTTVASVTPQVQRPTVEILAPPEGATFVRGQTVSVQARATAVSGVTLVELLANGIRVASQPPSELNPTSVDVVLDYHAEQPGTIILAVRAYSNAVVGLPAQRTVVVLPDTGPSLTQTFLPPSATPYNPQCRARVNAGGLRFRTGPGTEYDIINNFNAGQEPPVTGYADRPDGRWWQVLWGGQLGWISSLYTTQLGDCSTIRPAVIPASPTPVPSATPQPTVPGATATPTLPDLTLSLLEGPSDVTLGPDGTVQATYVIRVKNIGGQTSGQFRMAVLKPDGTVATFNVLGLNPGQEPQVPNEGVTVIFNTPGIARILVTVDDQNAVAESNELNNQAYKDVTVIPAPATATAAPTNTPG